MSRRAHLISIVLCAAAASLHAAQALSPLARLYDVPARSDKLLTAAVLTSKAGWKRIPEGSVTHRFSGHAVLLNGTLAVVLRAKAGTIDVYSIAGGAVNRRASVVCMAGRSSTAGGIETLGIAENASSAAALALSFGNGDSASVTFRLTTGQSILEIRPGRGASALDVITQARHVVVPDFFGDDMVFGPETSGRIDLPAENYFLNLLDGRDAIMMCVWQPRRLNASATIQESPSGQRARSVATIEMTKGKSVWLAVLQKKDIWHQVASPDSLSSSKAAWKPPFAAKWRCSRPRRTGFAVSWDLAAGSTTKPASGKSGDPVVVYPIDRTLGTPLTVFCPTDVLRNTLGVGPCEYILATEGLAVPANPTPGNVMTWLERQLKRRRGRPSAEEIRDRLREMTAHSARARGRIMQYKDLVAAVLAVCKDSAPLPPAARGLSATADRIRKIAGEGILAIGHVEGVEQLAAKVLALADKPDAAVKCEPLAAQLRAIGAAQSRTLSRCRAAALWLRQQCVMAARADGEVSGLAAKVRDRVERVLK